MNLEKNIKIKNRNKNIGWLCVCVQTPLSQQNNWETHWHTMQTDTDVPRHTHRARATKFTGSAFWIMTIRRSRAGVSETDLDNDMSHYSGRTTAQCCWSRSFSHTHALSWTRNSSVVCFYMVKQMRRNSHIHSILMERWMRSEPHSVLTIRYHSYQLDGAEKQ